MLSAVLRSDRAVQVSIGIIRVFVKLRQMVANDRELPRLIDELEQKYDGQFQVVFQAIRDDWISASASQTPDWISRRT